MGLYIHEIIYITLEYISLKTLMVNAWGISLATCWDLGSEDRKTESFVWRIVETRGLVTPHALKQYRSFCCCLTAVYCRIFASLTPCSWACEIMLFSNSSEQNIRTTSCTTTTSIWRSKKQNRIIRVKNTNKPVHCVWRLIDKTYFFCEITDWIKQISQWFCLHVIMTELGNWTRLSWVSVCEP